MMVVEITHLMMMILIVVIVIVLVIMVNIVNGDRYCYGDWDYGVWIYLIRAGHLYVISTTISFTMRTCSDYNHRDLFLNVSCSEAHPLGGVFLWLHRWNSWVLSSWQVFWMHSVMRFYMWHDNSWIYSDWSCGSCNCEMYHHPCQVQQKTWNISLEQVNISSS